MGALELQIFVSLMVVLGAAFVALICDFLKGNNEKLREFNVELLVRQQERERAESSRERSRGNGQTAASIQPLLNQKPLAHRQIEPERQAAQETATPVAEGMPANPRRRRGYRNEPAKQPDRGVPVTIAQVAEHRPVIDAMEDWARRVVERQAAGRPETATPISGPVAIQAGPPSPSRPVEEAKAQEPPTSQELYPIRGASSVPPQVSVATLAADAVFVSQGEAGSPEPSMYSVESERGSQLVNANALELQAPQDLQPIAESAALPARASLAAIAPEAVFAATNEEEIPDPSMSPVTPLIASAEHEQGVPHAKEEAPEPPASQELQPIALGSALPPQAVLVARAPEAAFTPASDAMPAGPSMASVAGELNGPHVNGLAEGGLAEVETPAAAPAPSLREADPPVLVVRHDAESPVAVSESTGPHFTEMAELAGLELKPVRAGTGAKGLESASLPFAAGQPAVGFALMRTVQLSPPDWAAPAESEHAVVSPCVEDAEVAEAEPVATGVPAWSEMDLGSDDSMELPGEHIVRVKVLDEGDLIGLGREMALSAEPVHPAPTRKVPGLTPVTPPAGGPLVPTGLISLSVDRTETEVQPGAPVSEPVMIELEVLVPVIEPVVEAIEPEEAGIDSYIELESEPEMRPKVVQMPVPAMSTQQDSLGSSRVQLPQGTWDRPVLAELLEHDVLHEGVVFCIGIVGFEELVAEHGRPAVKQSLASATDYFESLMDGRGFGCWAEESQFVMAVSASNAEAARMVSQQISEGLWDYQLRSLGSLPMIFHWGSAESANEPLRLALELAREQMVESGRARKQVLSASGRFRRRVVNA